MIRYLKLLSGLFLLLLLGSGPTGQAQTAPVVQVCQLSDFTSGPFGFAVYLHYLPGAHTPRYRWDANGGTFTIYADSSAKVTGRVFNDSLPNWQWDVEFWFINQLDYASWTALGRDVKIEYAPASLVNANKQDWLFWEFDSTRSRLFGVPGTHFGGDTLLIRHNPPNREFGLQYGLAANSKNGNFGLSGWFLFSGSYSGYGDINVNASCSAPVCDVALTASTSCTSDSTFAASVTIVGSGGPFSISDNQGTPPLVVNAPGTYLFGNYANGDTASIFVADQSVFACADTVAGLTNDCTPPPICDLGLSATAACVTDSTFSLTVTLSGTGSYTLSDNKGTNALTGLAAGTYTFGNYASGTVVSLFANDPAIAACADTVAGLTANCAPVVPVCGVSVDTLYADCASDTSFTIFVQFSGAGSNFQISDDQGTIPAGGLSAGLYSFGDYFNSTEVLITVTDLTIPGCDTTVGPVTADCTPVAVCDLSIDSLFTTCVSDTTFQVTVVIGGTGQFYQVFDNQGSQPFFPASAGTYTFGPFTNGSQVTISASDLAIFNCFEIAGPITEACGSGSLIEPGATLWATPASGLIQVGWEGHRIGLINGFFLQRSLSPEIPSEWQTLAWIPVSLPAPLPAVYEYTDETVAQNIEYTYRLQIVPLMGAQLYSDEVTAMITNDGAVWIGDFYPNPVTSGELTFGMKVPEHGEVKWYLYRTDGSLADNGIFKSVAGQQHYTLDLTSHSTGIYLLQIWYEGTFIRSKKILIYE